MTQKRRGLFTKLLFSYTAFVLLIALLMGGIAHFFAVRAYNAELEKVSVGTVRQFQRVVQTSVLDRAVKIATQVVTGKSTATKLDALFKSDAPQLTEISDLYVALGEIVANNVDFVEAIHVYDLHNRMILSSKLGVVYTAIPYGLYQYTHDWIAVHAQNHVAAQWLGTRESPYPGASGPVLTYICNSPMSNATQVYHGYIAIDIYERALSEICAVLTEEAGAALYIVDAAGKLLTHQDPALIGTGIDTLGMPGALTLSAVSSGSFAYQQGGADQYACYSEPLSNGWRLILSKPTASFYQASRVMQERLVLGSLFAILLGLSLAYWVTVRMYRPVRKLASCLDTVVGSGFAPAGAHQNEYAFIDRAIHSMSTELSLLRRRLEDNRALIKSNLVQSLINNTVHSRDALRQRMDLIGENPRGPWYNVIRLSLSETLVHSPQYENVELIKLNLCVLLEDITDEATLCLASETADNELVALVFARDKRLKEAVERIAFRVADQYQGHIRMSVGLWQGNPLALDKAYRSACEAALHAFFHPEWPYCAAEVTENAKPPEVDLLAPTVKDVADALRGWHAEAAVQALEGFLRATREDIYPIGLLQVRFEALQTAVQEGVCAMGQKMRDAFVPRFAALRKKHSVSEFIDALSGLLGELLPREGRPLSKNGETVAALSQYIQRNLAADLSLTRLAEIMGLSSSYLSRIFKEETRVNLIDYITNERFERARQLIEQTDMTIASITLQVGYPTHHYFSKRFKERYGVSPKDYRRAFCISRAQPHGVSKELTI